ncbi:hypothetical protein WMY93_010337 [Mugilogobius chulae]|uniref:Uncharacterized protein n=1 Tax=Mugilogobius chulae TaxID=88201 RepID=A0AAW0PJL2_9GOBI
MSSRLENANPVIFQRSGERLLTASEEDEDLIVVVVVVIVVAAAAGSDIIDVHITPGTHASEDAVNKQLADKERVAAALENSSLLEVVNQCLSTRNI